SWPTPESLAVGLPMIHRAAADCTRVRRDPGCPADPLDLAPPVLVVLHRGVSPAIRAGTCAGPGRHGGRVAEDAASCRPSPVTWNRHASVPGSERSEVPIGGASGDHRDELPGDVEF